MLNSKEKEKYNKIKSNTPNAFISSFNCTILVFSASIILKLLPLSIILPQLIILPSKKQNITQTQSKPLQHIQQIKQ